MELATGTVLERYTVERTLGAGGMAVVYLARHNQIGSLHAVKVLTVHSPAIRERLIQEGRVQAGLRHPNIVTVTDMVEVRGDPALVLEYVRGPSLAALLARTRPSLPQIDALARGILRGMATAHRQGLVHRDLKPANVLIAVSDEALVPKIADFGLGKLIRASAPSMTRSGATMGTPAYMAPEQIRDSASVDERADVFALGAMLYELLTGDLAFRGADTLDTFERIAHGRYEPLDDLAPGLPERMRVAVARALQVDREDRYPHAGALLEAWTGVAAGLAEEPLSDTGLWSAEILEAADALAPSAAESLDSERPAAVSAESPDTFALSIGEPSVAGDPAPTVQLEPIPWLEVLKWTALGPLIAAPFALGGLVATAGSFGRLLEVGPFAVLMVALATAAGGVVGTLGVLWQTGRVSRHIWWLVFPALLAILGNLGTGIGARQAMAAVMAAPLDQTAAMAMRACGLALTSELTGLTLVAMLLLVTAEMAAGLVLVRRGGIGRLSAPRRVAAFVVALVLGTVLWLVTTVWITEGAVPFAVFLILLGAGLGASAVSFEDPDPDERTSEARMLTVLAGATGVLAAAKVVWLQDIIGLLRTVDATNGVAAAEEFATGIESSGANLVLAWGAAAVFSGLIAISGPGRPVMRARTTLMDIVPVLLLFVPLGISKVWADREVGALTGEVVPAVLGVEVSRLVAIALTDRSLVEHRTQVPGVLDPAYALLGRLDQLRGIEALPEGALVVDPADSVLRQDDAIIAVDGHRIDGVASFVRQLAACDCTTAILTVDRSGTLVELHLAVKEQPPPQTE